MSQIVYILITIVGLLLGISSRADDVLTVGFGSCLVEDQPMPVWSAIVDRDPDVFIMMGDNVYADRGFYDEFTPPKNFQMAYERLSSNPEFRQFRNLVSVPTKRLISTWDDHDYGLNDGGVENEHKLAAKKAFMDFFNPTGLAVAASDEPGIYSSSVQTVGDLTVQVIALDTRSFRSAFEKRKNSALCSRGGWEFSSAPDATILGDEQWAWLEDQLEQSADVRLIVSSIQVLPTEQCFEKWANFPTERERLLALIAKKTGGGVILLSGDRHLSEISVLEREDIGYPLYEVTSSGLNNALKGRFEVAKEPNALRALPENVSENGFGEIAISQSNESGTTIHLRLFNESGRLLQSLSLALNDLQKVERVF